MKRIFLVVFAAPLALAAAEVSRDDAAIAARAWVDRGYAMGKLPAGRTVAGVDEVTDSDTGAQLRIVRFAGGGFVVLSADDLVDPVIAFSETGTGLDIDDDNPFWSLLRSDIAAREAASGVERGRTSALKKGAVVAIKSSESTEAQRKWANLLSDGTGGASSTGGGIRPLAVKSAAGLSSLSDIRVDSFVQSRWSQSGHANTPIGVPCYNYYTTNHYVCGCVSTAASQLMRYWCYPTENEPVEATYYRCWVNGNYFFPYMMGGTYDWDNMPLEPAWVVDITEEQRQAIGKLTYDVGVAVCMDWGEDGSSASVPSLVVVFTNNFHYASAHAVYYANSGSSAYSLTSFKNAMIPNLDARCPCVLSIKNSSSGHAILADGYGYSDSDFFIHLNMGWAGSGDAWYNPPNIEEYTAIAGFVYNAFPRKTGSIASGRVLDQTGNPVAGANVSLSDGQTTVTDVSGIYAFIAPAGTYDITATKDGFTTTGSVTLGETVGTTVYADIGRYGAYQTGVGRNGNVHDNDLQFTALPSTATPVYSPGSCAFYPVTNITISCADVTATIRYTLDGSTPDETSTVYAGPIRIDDAVTIKARAFAPGCNASAVAIADYVYDPGDGPQKGDNFDDPIDIYGASGMRVVANNENYTLEDGEPTHVIIDGTPKNQSRTIWYRWTAPATGRVLFRSFCRRDNGAYYTNIAAYEGDSLASATKIAFSITNDANFAQLLPLDVVQGKTYRIVGMMPSIKETYYGTFTLRWDDEFPTGGDPTPVLGSCTAAVDGTNVDFSVSIRSIEAPAAVSVFYGPDESHLTELSLGTANASGTLTAAATGLANGSYIWFARAVSTVDDVPHAAESVRKTFTVAWAPPPEGILVADGFSSDDYTATATLKSSSGGNTTGFTTERTWTAKTATDVLFVNNDGLTFPAGWDSTRYSSGGYSVGFKKSGTTTTSDIRGACRQLAEGAFPTSGTIYYRILLRHQAGASHCPTDYYRAAGFLPQDFKSLDDEYAQYNGKTLFNKGLWLGTRGKGNGASSINLRLGSKDLVLVDTMQEGVTYLCVAKMEIDADGANEKATGFAMPVNDYKAPVWTNAVLRENVVGADAPLAWFGIMGGYKTSNKYVSFDEIAVSTILADVVPVPESTALPLSILRSAEQGGGMLFAGSGAGRSLTFYLDDTLSSAYYAVFTNGTLQGPFFAAADGIPGLTSGILELPVDAKEPSKFFAIGVSDKPISVGDPLVPGANAGN